MFIHADLLTKNRLVAEGFAWSKEQIGAVDIPARARTADHYPPAGENKTKQKLEEDLC